MFDSGAATHSGYLCSEKKGVPGLNTILLSMEVQPFTWSGINFTHSCSPITSQYFIEFYQKHVSSVKLSDGTVHSDSLVIFFGHLLRDSS